MTRKEVKQRISNFMNCIIKIPFKVIDAQRTRKEDYKKSLNFENGTIVPLSEFDKLVNKSICRHPIKTGICTLRRRIKIGFFDEDIYRVEIVTDKSNNCTWIWVKYSRLIDFEEENIFGRSHADGFLYKLPYINKKHIKNNPIIENKINEIEEAGEVKNYYLKISRDACNHKNTEGESSLIFDELTNQFKCTICGRKFIIVEN